MDIDSIFIQNTKKHLEPEGSSLINVSTEITTGRLIINIITNNRAIYTQLEHWIDRSSQHHAKTRMSQDISAKKITSEVLKQMQFNG
jgi:hypothetical protein